MEPTDKLGIEIVFNNINYLISNKILNLSDISKAYLDKSILFFNDLIKSLNSLSSSSPEVDDENSTYFMFPNLKEVVSSVPNPPLNINEKNLKEIKKYFEETIVEIQKLKRNPEKFYTTDKSSELKTLSKTLSSIHAEAFQSHTFETEETFSNSYFLC